MDGWQESCSKLQNRKGPILLWSFREQEISFEHHRNKILKCLFCLLPILSLFFLFCFPFLFFPVQYRGVEQCDVSSGTLGIMSNLKHFKHRKWHINRSCGANFNKMEALYGSFICRQESDMYLEGEGWMHRRDLFVFLALRQYDSCFKAQLGTSKKPSFKS